MAADLWEPFGSSHSKCLEETPQTTIEVADQSDSLQQAASAYLGPFLCGFFFCLVPEDQVFTVVQASSRREVFDYPVCTHAVCRWVDVGWDCLAPYMMAGSQGPANELCQNSGCPGN